MCGIAGWFGARAGFDPAAAMGALRHRGPDGQGVWRDAAGQAGFVHTRLAILDLTDAGAQPMGLRNEGSAWVTCTSAFADARYWLIFNGEIYNFAELKAELEGTGEAFHGHSDTEVLLRLLALEGAAAPPRLAGMFAFAFYDREQGCGMLARDAFGIKPLFYVQQEDGIAFASEVRALRASTQPPRCQPDALRDTLMWGTVQEPESSVDGVRQLPAGSYLRWDAAGARIERWHELRFSGAPPAAPVAATRAALLESVERHLVSDVPVGIF